MLNQHKLTLTTEDNIWFFDFLNQLMDAESGIKLDNIKDLKDVKKNIEIVALRQGMYVYAIALSKTGYNATLEINCKKGKPISHNCYSVVKDVCHVEGCDLIEIGSININYVIKFKDSIGYIVDIPIPEALLKRYLTENQKQKITSFKNKYKDSSKFSVKYFQILKSSPR